MEQEQLFSADKAAVGGTVLALHHCHTPQSHSFYGCFSNQG